jgi:hypothetical protein
MFTFTTRKNYQLLCSLTFFFGLITPWSALAAPQSNILIKTCADLQNIKNDLAGNYVLVADIDCSGVSFNPIGSFTSDLMNSFKGTLQGNGHKILNLHISSTDPDAFVGLFAAANQASISDLIFDHPQIVGINYVGTLVAYALNTTINNAHIEQGSVAVPNSYSGDNRYMGGLVGFMSGYWMYDSSILNSSSSATVQGSIYAEYMGGLVGAIDCGTVDNSHVTGSIQGGNSSGNGRIGDLAGTLAGSVQNSYATGNVTTDNSTYVGGLIGEYSDCNGLANISNSYASGAVKGHSYVGGLIGASYSYSGWITNSYATGNVSGDSKSGGLIGFNLNPNLVYNSYWDTQTSGLSISAGGTGKTTAEMHQKSTYVDWDFLNIWDITDGDSYPWLRSSSDTKVKQKIHQP